MIRNAGIDWPRVSRLAVGGLVAVVLVVGAAAAEDVPGAKDDPLLSRPAGAEILAYEALDNQDFAIPTSVPEGFESVVPKAETVEGDRRRILYVAPADQSTEAIFARYADTLSQAGFDILFTCELEACGEPGVLVNDVLYPKSGRLSDSGEVSQMAFSFPAQPRYLAARMNRPEGDVYVSLYIARENFDHFDRTHNRPLILADIVRAQPMRYVADIDASMMARDIGDLGRVAVYGIYFDYDSAEIQPDSVDTLREIAKFMKENPQIEVYVVGHTDSQGGFDYNLDLSKNRARSVVKALAEQFEIEASRMTPAGVGLLAPMASNDSAEGRARNRRVELVKK